MEVPNGLMEWLANGRRGISSNAIVTHLTGINSMAGWGSSWNHPHDPADLWRCRKLLEQVPSLKDRLPEMSTLSPQWAALVSKWDQLCLTMDKEAPNWGDGTGSAPITYAMMRALIDGSK